MKRPLCRRSAGFGLADLLVVAVLIPLVGVAMVGCWRTGSRQPANRVKCASNLRQIGQAILLYSNENKRAYPRTTFVGGATVIPTWGTGAESSNPFSETGPAPNDVTAALFLLLRTQAITSEVFVCPSAASEKFDFGGGMKTAADWSNWPGTDGIRKHLSYSYQNPYPDDAAVKAGFKLDNSLSAEFAVAADMNPGVSKDKNVLAVTSTASFKDMKQANSRNHDGDGQNVLFGDGHVEFVSNPFVGINRDMIYARRAGSTGFASIEVRNSPLDASDNVLLPAEQ